MTCFCHSINVKLVLLKKNDNLLFWALKDPQLRVYKLKLKVVRYPTKAKKYNWMQWTNAMKIKLNTCVQKYSLKHFYRSKAKHGVINWNKQPTITPKEAGNSFETCLQKMPAKKSWFISILTMMIVVTIVANRNFNSNNKQQHVKRNESQQRQEAETNMAERANEVKRINVLSLLNN